MGRHDRHLPARRFLNKAVAHDATPDTDHLKRLARGQGTGTKEDAKAARAADTDDEREQ